MKNNTDIQNQHKHKIITIITVILSAVLIAFIGYTILSYYDIISDNPIKNTQNANQSNNAGNIANAAQDGKNSSSNVINSTTTITENTNITGTISNQLNSDNISANSTNVTADNQNNDPSYSDNGYILRSREPTGLPVG